MSHETSGLDLEHQYYFVSARIAAGKGVPFLGAGGNLCGRPVGADWLRDRYLPNAGELAQYLAEDYPYLDLRDARDLSRVSQYVDLFGGDAVLFEKLRALFAGEEIDVVYYAATRQQAGRFVHVRPDGTRVAVPKNYRGFDVGQRTVILKIHGAVDREEESGDSYVITEDHYIDYVARTNVYNLIPAALMAKMSASHFIFLGYGMRDWNLRVILHHIWSQQTRTYTSWAIEKQPDPIDEKFWDRHGVDIVAIPLEEWVEG